MNLVPNVWGPLQRGGAQPLTLCRKPTKSSLSGLAVVQPSVGLSRPGSVPGGGPPCCWEAGGRLHCVETLWTGVAPPMGGVIPGGGRSLSWEHSRDCSLRSRCIFCSGRKNQTQNQPVKKRNDRHDGRFKVRFTVKSCAGVCHGS